MRNEHDACRELARPRRFLLVGDSKLVSYTNLRSMIDAGVKFIAPAMSLLFMVFRMEWPTGAAVDECYMYLWF
jgi:hypothetical protein